MIKNRPSRSAVKMMLVVGGLVAAMPARGQPAGFPCNGRPKQQTGKAGLLCDGRSKVKMQCNERLKQTGKAGFTCDGARSLKNGTPGSISNGARPIQQPAGR